MAIPPFFCFIVHGHVFLEESRVQPPARRRSVLHSKIDRTKKVRDTLLCVPRFFVTTHRFCCPHTPRISQGKECVQGKPLPGFPCAFNQRAAVGGPEFCSAKISSTKREPPKGWLSFVTTRSCCCLCISACSVSATAVKRFLPSGAVIYMQFLFFCCTAD